MKYLLLIYVNPEVWESLSEEQRNEVYRDHDEFQKVVKETGEMLGTEALADPPDSATVRVRDGVPVVTDGPYLEAKEYLAGYYRVECASKERAIELAAMLPDARYTGMEVRPVVADDGGVPQYVVQPIGWVESPLVDRETAPMQGDEGAPDAWLVFEDSMREAMRDLQVGTDVIVLTWLDRARRDVLVVHPRGDRARPETGVFSTRSPDRPNPIGLHRVSIVSIDGTRVRVRNLEALNATPIVDVKPVLDPGTER